jgi:hypothetical protein
MHDPAAMFARMTRAVRLTIALEAKTAENLRALIAGLPLERETRRVEAAKRAEAAGEARRKAAKDKIHDLVYEAILTEDGDGKDSLDVWEALEERLEEDDAYMDLADRPVEGVVKQMCADLCIKPDWTRWTGEGWKPGPFPSRPKWSRFNQPSPTKLMPDLQPGTWVFTPEAAGP